MDANNRTAVTKTARRKARKLALAKKHNANAKAKTRPSIVGVQQVEQVTITKTARSRQKKASRRANADGKAYMHGAKQRLRESKCYPSEDRLHALACGKPYPAEPCECRRCVDTKHEGWPVGYRRGSKSYECWLHEQSEWFLHALPSSHSIVRIGGGK